MFEKHFEINGLHNGEKIFCTVNAYHDCPYCDENGVCHITDPIADCNDFFLFFASWEEWEQAGESCSTTDFSEEEIAWAEQNLDFNGVEDYSDDEIGFNPVS